MGDVGWSTTILVVTAVAIVMVVLAVAAAMQAGRSIEDVGTSGSSS